MNSNLLRMASADPGLTNSLQEAVLLLCKAGLKYDSTLSIDGLLAVTIDQKEVFIVNIKESVTCLEDDCSPCLKDNSQIESKSRKESSTGTTSSDLHRMSSPFKSQTQEKLIDSSSVGSDCCSVVDSVPVNMTTTWGSFSPEVSYKESKSVIDSPLSKWFEPGQRLSSAAAPVISTFLHEKSDDSTASKELCLQNQDGSIMSSDQPDIKPNSIAGQRFPQIKTEPLDEYHYQVHDQGSADVHTRTRDCQDGTIDYLSFSAYTYSTQHRLQAQMAAALSQDSSTTPSSHVRKTTSITLPKRQRRTLEKSLCVNCGTSTTSLWRRSDDGQLLCNACGCYFKRHKVHRPLSFLRDNIRQRSHQQVYSWTMGIPLS